MNQKAIYEVTITEKLGQLQVPDMRDAIWSRIETQLDIDMPEDNGPDSPDSPDISKWRAASFKFGAFAIVVALVTVFFINKNRAKQKRNNKSVPATEQVTTSPQTNPVSPPGTKPNTTPAPDTNNGTNIPPTRNDSPFYDRPVQAPLVIDTNSHRGNVVTPSLQVPPQTILNPPPLKQDTVQKKSRGVKGIKNQDYHISLKKDSLP